MPPRVAGEGWGLLPEELIGSPGPVQRFPDEGRGARNLFVAQPEPFRHPASVFPVLLQFVLASVNEGQPGIVGQHEADEAVGALLAVLLDHPLVLGERRIADLNPAFGQIIGTGLLRMLFPMGVPGAEEDGDAIIHAGNHQRGLAGLNADDCLGAEAVTEDNGVVGLFQSIYALLFGLDVQAEIQDFVLRALRHEGDHLFYNSRTGKNKKALAHSEAQLVAQFGVSPMTVRRAINLLLSRGIVSTAQGKGAFVRGLAITEATFRLQEVGEEEAERTVRLLQATILPADERVARKLSISTGTRVIYLRRLVSRAEGPTMYHREYLIYDPRRPVVEALEGLFKGNGGQGLRRGDLSIEAVTLTPEEADLLGVSPGSPAFCLEHIFYDFTNQPIAWGWFIWRADRFRLTTRIGPDVEK